MRFSNKVNKIVYGGDYNPEQWPEEIWADDMRLLKEANIDIVTLNVFSWAALQPSEETYDFSKLDKIMEMVRDNGLQVCLATSTGAHPAWMAKKYPDILRTEFNGLKRKFGGRHNSCPNSPTYEKYSVRLAQKIAERYRDYNNIVAWHISNEFGGECYCENCEKAFRVWLKKKYQTIENVNRAWNTAFWGHTFYDWDEIVLPNLLSEHFEQDRSQFQGITVDYKRFNSESILECYKREYDTLKAITPDIPITTNLMGFYKPLDYKMWAKYMDVVSWDNYPSNEDSPAQIAMSHDLMRGINGGEPFLLMEQTPSVTNWLPYNALKRPGVMRLWSYQAVAHGSDSVQYFQWRKGRGASEKFHGAVVDHYGKEDTRVFHEVAKLGENLEKMDKIVGTYPETEVAVIYDWDNRWAIDNLQGLNDRRNYEQTCKKHHRPFWNMGISTDVNDMNQDFSQYKLVVAPMLYMLKPDVAENIRTYVENGGTVVFTYCTGNVDESDLCFTGGFPGNGLMDIAGIWMEEVDPLYDTDRNTIEIADGQNGFSKASYECKDFCEIIHPQVDTEVLAVYGSDFYQGMAAVTKHTYGKGSCYYIATRTEDAFLEDFYRKLANELGLTKPPVEKIPDGVSVTRRCGDKKDYLFLMNYSEKEQKIVLTTEGTSLLSGQAQEEIVLDKYGYDVIEIERK